MSKTDLGRSSWKRGTLASTLVLTLLAQACDQAPKQSGAVMPPQGPSAYQTSAPAESSAAEPLAEQESAPKSASQSEGAKDDSDGSSQELRRAAPSKPPPSPPPPAPSAVSLGAAAAEAPEMEFSLSAKRAAPQGTAGRGVAGGSASGSRMKSIASGVVQGPVAQARPAEPNTEDYAASEETPFVSAKDAPLSTFSIDVDTASYSNVRRFLQQGQLPPSGAVRVEELVNYFPYAYAEPTGDVPFSVTTEISQAPWNPKHQLLHVGLQGKHLASAAVPPRNLVFLLDVSGSMNEPNKLPLLKRSLGTLIETLGSRDQVAVVVYAGASGLVLPPTAADRRAEISTALDRLEAGGSTNGGEGIELAYEVARRMARPGSTSRVILATDGDFNVGVTSQSELFSLIEQQRKSGVFLSVLGFGMGNYKDSTLELLADKGNGNYAYIDTLAEARKVLVAQGGATLTTLAKDVKLQLEFNPERVGAYRLIGYENRRLASRDFNDDAKDAGELGAGHSVTALYELVPPGVPVDSGKVDPLRYQVPPTAASGHKGELCTLKLRYKQPQSERSQLLQHVVQDQNSGLAATSPSFRFAAAVAVFGMTLRESPDRGNASFVLARQLAEGALGADSEGYRREFLGLIDTAQSLRR